MYEYNHHYSVSVLKGMGAVEFKYTLELLALCPRRTAAVAELHRSLRRIRDTGTVMHRRVVYHQAHELLPPLLL